jgi:hypothetical protein
MPPVIRPFNPPVAQPNTRAVRSPLSAEARQAQRAFFQQAVAAPATTQPAAAPAQVKALTGAHSGQAIEPVVTRVRTQPIPDEKPTGYRRPGSFVDIKV